MINFLCKKWRVTYQNSLLGLLFGFFVTTLSSVAIADECAKLTPIAKKYFSDNQDLVGFQCGKDIDKQLVLKTKIDGFNLIAIEPEYVTEQSGTAIYKGDRVFTGTISYTDQINDGYFFNTRIDKSTVFNFSVGSGYIKKDRLKLKYPENNTCKDGEELFAKAKLRIKLFEQTVSDGSCQGGTTPLEYDIISIGKYVCRKELGADVD